MDVATGANSRICLKGAWLLAIFYAACIGVARPVGVQALLFSNLFFSVVGVLLQRSNMLTRERLLLAAVGMINGAAFVVVSNHRVLTLNTLLFYFVAGCLLLPLYADGRSPESLRQYALGVLRYVKWISSCCLAGTGFRQCCVPDIGRLRRWLERLDRSAVVSLYLAAILLTAFHVLFAQVNDEYLEFVNGIFRVLWEFLQYLYELGIITMTVQALLMAWFFSIVFSVKASGDAYSCSGEAIPFRILKTSLFGSIGVFALFSCFQSKLLFASPFDLTYKELALYVQKGFWELLIIAALGAMLWDMCEAALAREEQPTGKGKSLLLLFTAELLLLSFFSQHKLISQQIIFGFRDKRVFAACGVLLISISFILMAAQLLGRIRTRRVFCTQYLLFAAVVLTLSFGKLDLWISRCNPIRFVHHGRSYKDYAYLLANSFDNVSEWPALMREAYNSGIPVPADYYWGPYTSLCGARSYREHRPNLIRARHQYLKRRYGAPQGLREMLRFNAAEYQAWRFHETHPEEIEKFADFVDAGCGV